MIIKIQLLSNHTICSIRNIRRKLIDEGFSFINTGHDEEYQYMYAKYEKDDPLDIKTVIDLFSCCGFKCEIIKKVGINNERK